jgi:hypothetical protein
MFTFDCIQLPKLNESPEAVVLDANSSTGTLALANCNGCQADMKRCADLPSQEAPSIPSNEASTVGSYFDIIFKLS